MSSRVRVSARSRPFLPFYLHFNWPSGFWACVKSCLVGASDKLIIYIYNLLNFFERTVPKTQKVWLSLTSRHHGYISFKTINCNVKTHISSFSVVLYDKEMKNHNTFHFKTLTLSSFLLERSETMRDGVLLNWPFITSLWIYMQALTSLFPEWVVVSRGPHKCLPLGTRWPLFWLFFLTDQLTVRSVRTCVCISS